MSANDLERAVAALAVDHRLLAPPAALRILREARQGSRPLVRLLTGEVPETALLAAVAREIGTRFCDLYATGTGYRLDEDLLRRADVALLKQFSALPLVDGTGKVVVAIANPADLTMVDYLRQCYPEGMSLVLASRAQIQAKLALASHSMFAPAAETPAPAVPPSTPTPTLPAAAQLRNPLVDWIDTVLEAAVAQGASDVHFSLNGDGTLLLRFRVDGILRQQLAPWRGREMEIFGIIMNRAGLDAANYRDPQDGTFSLTAGGRPVDVRVAMLPQVNGPTIVLRLLDSLNVRARLADMGFSDAQLAAMIGVAHAPQGTIVLAGPTGSGKTTTLYALIREIASVERNVVTIEDPVEYRLPLVNQTQIRPGGGDKALTFAKALRSILRLDPDVILVGEIRDGETARIAMESAITGHLVLTTVHASSALGIYTRLIEMGAPPYMVAEAISLAVSQRLVRRLHDCARLEAPTPAEAASLTRLGVAVPDRLLHPGGCEGCGGTGFRGRLATVEVLVPTPRLRAMIGERRPLEELDEEARAGGFVPMIADGLRHVVEGRSTVAEVLRVVEVDR